jgi:hypothetical protein
MTGFQLNILHQPLWEFWKSDSFYQTLPGILMIPHINPFKIKARG